MVTFITSNNSLFYLCFNLICVCYQGAQIFKHFYIFVSVAIYFSFLLFISLYLSINHIFGFGYIYGQANHLLFLQSPLSTTLSAYKRHCLVLWNVFPPVFAFTFLITFSIHRENKSVDNAISCLSPTTVSKLGDIFPWIFTLLVLSNVILTSLTHLLGIPNCFIISVN